MNGKIVSVSPEQGVGVIAPDEEGGELSLDAQAAQRPPPDVRQLHQSEQLRDPVGVVAEFNEAPARRNGNSLARRQVVERCLQLLAGDDVDVRLRERSRSA